MLFQIEDHFGNHQSISYQKQELHGCKTLMTVMQCLNLNFFSSPKALHHSPCSPLFSSISFLPHSCAKPMYYTSASAHTSDSQNSLLPLSKGALPDILSPSPHPQQLKKEVYGHMRTNWQRAMAEVIRRICGQLTCLGKSSIA